MHNDNPSISDTEPFFPASEDRKIAESNDRAATLDQIAQTLPNSDVSAVADVQPNGDAVSAATAPETADVSDVAKSPFHVLDQPGRLDGKLLAPGVYHVGKDKEGKDTITRICSPLHIDAVTHDAHEGNYGRLLRFRNTSGTWHTWAMPQELLRGSGEELRGELLAMGVELTPGSQARNLLMTYLQARPPQRQMRCALQVGWDGNAFVLPDTVIGPDAENVIFQSGERGHEEYTRAGTLEGWRETIAAKAIGNPLLTLALSAAFAGPLLAKCHQEGGGLHFVGDSSTGKTTLIEAACSIWGGPNYRRSWRTTSNGMEGAATLFNDGLLALDEISECDPREVGAIVYALGNGRGKQRASRTGTARSVTRWRTFVLSSGERTISTSMLEGGYRAKAGQGVRLLDIPASGTFGAWDDLHGQATGAAFSDAIKTAAITHHGHAGRAFLERLTHDTQDLAAYLERLKQAPLFAATDGQHKRVAARFALIATAGELATEYGITGWPEGLALGAALHGFQAWLATRGEGNDERRQIIERVSGFIERHGDGRFSNADVTGHDVIRDRAGWYRDETEGRVYLFTKDGLREALKGFDFRRALDHLIEAGMLPKAQANGERSRFYRIDGRAMKLYPITLKEAL
jgi:putative DNA primase/helicase